MDELRNLAERCEQAIGWDRELDCRIWVAVFGPDEPFESMAAAVVDYDLWVAQRYTASLDAAMTLVPEGWTFANLSQGDGKGWWCELRRGHLTSFDATAFSKQLNNASPALAITAAALRARATPIHPDNERLQEAEKPT